MGQTHGDPQPCHKGECPDRSQPPHFPRDGRGAPGQELLSSRHCERAPAPTDPHIHVCTHQHARPGAHTPTRSPRRYRRHRALSPVGKYPLCWPNPASSCSSPSPCAPLIPPIPRFYPFICFWVCAWIPSGPQRSGAGDPWGLSRRRGEPRVPGARRGGEGAGRGSRRAALPALPLSLRPRLSTHALAPAPGCRTLFSGDSRTPPGGGSGRAALERSPRTAPRDSAPRGACPSGGTAAPNTTSPGRPPGGGASGVGKRWPGRDWGSGESSEPPRTFQRFYGTCREERVGEEAGLERAVAMWL